MSPAPHTFLSNDKPRAQLPHGFKGPIADMPLITPSSVITLAIVILVATLILAFLTKMVQLWRRKAMSSRDFLAPDRSPDAWESFKQDLLLAGHRRSDQIEFANFISLAFRRAIEIKTGLPTAERTTPEIKQILLVNHIEGISKDEFITILQRLDEIRFAGTPLVEREIQDLFDNLINLVNQLESSKGRFEPLPTEAQRPIFTD